MNADAFETTFDGFLDNSFFTLQPAKGAHRSGLDALLLAASVPDGAKGHMADLGAGCGAAGMAVAQRCPQIAADLLERDASMLGLLDQTLKRPENAHLTDRLRVIETDLSRTEEARQTGHYDFLIANPPYNGPHMQVSPNKERASAHAETPDLVLQWCKAASAMAKHKARFSLILRPENLKDALLALEGRFGSVSLLPIAPKADGPANRILLMAKKGGRAPFKILPAFCVHGPNGQFTPMAEAIFRGRQGLQLK